MRPAPTPPCELEEPAVDALLSGACWPESISGQRALPSWTSPVWLR